MSGSSRDHPVPSSEERSEFRRVLCSRCTMQHFIFNLADGDRQRAASFLRAKRWVVGREERHRGALAPGDLVLVFVALTREFVGRAKLETALLDPIPSDAATSGPAVSEVLLDDVEEWT